MTINDRPATVQALPSVDDLRARALESLRRCGAEIPEPVGRWFHAASPIIGSPLIELGQAGGEDVQRAISEAKEAFASWRSVPGPVRGQLVKRFGELLSEHQTDIANLVSIEAGKITSEALGEVQEMIDICDLAVGISRQLDGRTIASERPGHRLSETWLPLGVVAVISAFNFPAAVWSWNTAIALVAGDSVVWKPSLKTALTSLACDALLRQAITESGAPQAIHRLVLADDDGAGVLVDSPDVALVSATGSERMGQIVAPRIAARLGRSLLELGGNNAAVVAPSADLELAVRAIVFAAAGTAGQRCTTMRRVISHESVADELTERLSAAFAGLPIGDPMREGTLVGPLIDGRAFEAMRSALEQAARDGGELLAGGSRRQAEGRDNAFYVEPALVRMPAQTEIVRTETFAPLLYLMTYAELPDAIAIHNDVPQGLSSSIFTTDLREAERFVAAGGADCGIVNVNIGTSGAEIGGAFGGEKTTGGGRESGSDSWKAYMRRVTTTVNYSDELPLAQGVNFG
jgi:aldehyde dehydrogenase (NAD+)